MKLKKWIIRILGFVILASVVYYFLPEDKLPENKKIDKLIVHKEAGILDAFAEGHIIKRYKISIGRNPNGDKEFEGDKRTPEGSYVINDKNSRSAYHKNLGISYPNLDDLEDARKRGVKLGGQIKIHGIKNGFGFIGKFHRLFNWTAGCIAVTNKEMDELYAAVEKGTPIVINP